MNAEAENKILKEESVNHFLNSETDCLTVPGHVVLKLPCCEIDDLLFIGRRANPGTSWHLLTDFNFCFNYFVLFCLKIMLA